MKKNNPDLSEIRQKYCRTISTKQDRHPNCGMYPFNSKIKEKLNHRFITPQEAMRLMGFDNNDYEVIPKNIIKKENIYKQAGNSIVVPILESIFKEIAKIEKAL